MSEIDYKARYEALIRLIENDSGQGIYMQGHMTKEAMEDPELKKTDAYKCGWNDYAIERSHKLEAMIERADDGLSDNMTMLLASGDCFLDENGTLSINMNDVWAWACSDIPKVPATEINEVARLFRLYGTAGLMYWYSCKNANMRSEFHDNNRAIDFVRHEEQIRKDVPNSSQRAYKKIEYTLGTSDRKKPDPSKPSTWERLTARFRR